MDFASGCSELLESIWRVCLYKFASTYAARLDGTPPEGLEITRDVLILQLYHVRGPSKARDEQPPYLDRRRIYSDHVLLLTTSSVSISLWRPNQGSMVRGVPGRAARPTQ